jgi:phosphoglucosamine mutase
MCALFGTDGVRGVANQKPLTAETALAIGRAVAYVCRNHTNRHRIIIGKDTRISGYMLETALTAGISSMGVDTLLVGPMPTPGIAFITHSMRADAGIVISASHNPYQDNGIKIFSKSGFKINSATEKQIEDLIVNNTIKDIRPTADKIGKAYRIDDALGRYIVFCKNTLPSNLTFSGVKIVLDCANGATYKVAPIIFSELGADVITVNDNPDGMNINKNCGALYPQELAETVKETNADVGLAFDGDGDRLIPVDEKGNTLTGDHLIALSAKAMKAANKLQNNMVITTAMSNFGFRLMMQKEGITLEQAPVGDRHVLSKMLERGAVLGGEESGHIIYLEHHTTGDGIISALQLLAIMQNQKRPLSELASVFKKYPQKLQSIPVKTKPPLENIEPVQQAIKNVENKLNGQGRVLVRYSGTEYLCRIMVEADTYDKVEEYTQYLSDAIQTAIGKST